MVVTRKRSCSTSETSSTPRGAKTRKQDEGGTTITTRTSTRGVVESGTGTSTSTPRRTRRVTDSIAEAVTSSPRTTRAKQGKGNEAVTSESSNDEVTILEVIKVKQGRNSESRTPVKGKNECANDKTADNVDSSVSSSIQKNKLVVKLRDINSAIPQSPKSRTVSGGDRGTAVDTPSTPVRRSRRLSGSGLEEVVDKETPSKKSFTIARILGMEEDKEETSSLSVLPVIEEDTEHTDKESPKKDTPKKAIVLKEDQVKEKLDSEAESDCQDLTAGKDKTENETQTVVDQPVAVDECDSKDDPAENEAQDKNSNEAMETEDIKSTSNVTDIESSSNAEMETGGEQDSEEPKSNSTKVTKSNDSQEGKTESTKLPESNCIMESTESSVTCKESKTLTSNISDENANNEKMNGLLSTMGSDKKVTKVIPQMEKRIDQLRSIPKGRPISGRWWKTDKQRFRSINKDATGKKSWSKKMQLKQWREDVLAKSAAIEAEKKQKKLDLKERQRINKERREENARKSEIVQVIKDPRKIKKMKRKQLRQLETRDTTNLK